ncbi:unnamed protein product [Pedinophyceae sp. YPF-701]|nr:unnamed protein product [Pedinophyceae sp. YPF-701]
MASQLPPAAKAALEKLDWLMSFSSQHESGAAVSTVGKGLAAWLTASFFLLLIPWTRPIIAFEASALLFRPWTLITGAASEPNASLLITSVCTGTMATRIIEPVLGTSGLVWLLATTLPWVTISVWTTQVVRCLFGAAPAILSAPVASSQGLLAALLVALRYTAPNEKLHVMGGRHVLDVAMLPGLLVAYLAVVGALGFAGGHHALYAAAGAYTAWFYLRFVRVAAPGAGRGDPSHEFRFAVFLPGQVRPALEPHLAKLRQICAKYLPEEGLPAGAGRDSRAEVRMQGLPVAGALSGATTTERAAQRGRALVDERVAGKESAGGDPVV